ARRPAARAARGLMRPRVAVLAVASAAGEVGGAERLFTGLADALRAQGLDAEVVAAVSDEADFDAIRGSYLRFFDLDLSGFDGVISAKAPSYAARHPNHVCYLMHTMRVFYDMFEVERPHPWKGDFDQRDEVQRLDALALRPPGVRRIFAIGEEVRLRLLGSLGLDATVLRHPSTLGGLAPAPGGVAPRRLLMPGRLHRWKRVDLAIRAMRDVPGDVELLVTGTGEDEARIRALAAGDPRIRFLGRVEEAELARLYATSLAVLFVPLREDLGLVTLEAFGCARPVITCADSGEPARLVRDGVTGLVARPDPASVAAAINRLVADPARASQLGENGMREGSAITWANVGRTLSAALQPGFGRRAA
ncbi:glycosyltransferase family 4 protein, partial [Falsiroseomonas sp. CW058]|uniref:glycosyltransferase family 4 protein n=1 Tax=Falsiroseomonas sp. CW058 TaxID=3388664 RepID=UPI003D310EAE